MELTLEQQLEIRKYELMLQNTNDVNALRALALQALTLAIRRQAFAESVMRQNLGIEGAKPQPYFPDELL